MRSKQQAETLRHFQIHAANWGRKALARDNVEVNVIRQRNSYVLEVIRHRRSTRATLDVGCGTGDLVREIARLGIFATGVDFARPMIEIAQRKARTESIADAHFCCSSIFDMELAERYFDVISANGFIEYLSPEQLDRFWDLSHQCLRPGGSLVFGSRNRLFNLFSLNSFTSEELDQGTVPLLLEEAVALASGVPFRTLMTMKTVPLQSGDHHHPRTGVEVGTRYQFTPLQLIRQLVIKGFTPIHACPIHIHGVPPAFKDANPSVHARISRMLQNYAHRHTSLLPWSSSFMIHAQKPKRKRSN